MARYECRDENGVTFATSDDWGIASTEFRNWSGYFWRRNQIIFDTTIAGAGIWDNDDDSFAFQLVVDNDDDYDDRPWGEQQSQIDYLESRYDGMYGDWD